MSVSSKLDTTVGQIQAYAAVLEHFPNDQLSAKAIVDWMANGGQITQSFDVLQLLFSLFPAMDNWEETVLRWVNMWLLGKPGVSNDKLSPRKEGKKYGDGHTSSSVGDSPTLQSLEMVIKTSLLAVCNTILSCEVNPIISDRLFDSGEYTNGRKNDVGEGVKLPLSFIDSMSVLYTPPIGQRGKYCYFDVTDDAWVAVKKEKKKSIARAKKEEEKNNGNSTEIEESAATKTTTTLQKVAIPANEMWKSRDFDAFLWYVINRGGSSSNVYSIWTNRYRPYKYAIEHNDAYHLYVTEGEIDLYNAGQEGRAIVPTTSITLTNKVDTSEAPVLAPTTEFWKKNSNNIEWVFNGKVYVTGNTVSVFSRDCNPIEKVSYLTPAGYLKVKQELKEIFKQYKDNTSKCIKVQYIFKLEDDVISTRTIMYHIAEGKSDIGEELKYNTVTENWSDTTALLTNKQTINKVDIKKLKFENLTRTTKSKTRNNKNSFKKKQLARFQYQEGGNLGEGGIQMWISPKDYYRAWGWGDFSTNKPLLVWEWDFLNSIQIFDPFVVISQIIDGLCNISSQIVLPFNKEVIKGAVGEIVKKVISQDDMKVEDCYFNFNNDEFNSLLERAEKIRRGYINSTGTLNADVLIDKISDLDRQNPSAQLSGAVTTVSREIAFADSFTAATDDASGDVHISYMLQTLLINICTPLVIPLFRPKCLICLAVALNAAGRELPDSWDEVISLLAPVLTQVIVAVKDMLVQMLLNQLLAWMEWLVSKVTTLIVTEQIEIYKRLLEQLYVLFQQWYRLFGATKGNIDNVNYADIDTTVTTDANETAKC